MCLRINNILRNHSAVRKEIVENMIALLNKGVTPWVPERGSISASGDLIPTCYIVTLLNGHQNSKAYLPNKDELVPASEALSYANVKPIEFYPKEALAIVNGTPASTSLASINICEALMLAHLS